MNGTHASGQGSNSVQVRQFNERIVLQALRRLGGASKSDVARASRLTANAVGMIARHLEHQGLVVAQGKKYDGRRGQPATMLALNPAGAYALGVRIDRGLLETVAVDFCGAIVARVVHEGTLPRPDVTFDQLARDVETVSAALPVGVRGRIAGLGVAMPYDLGSWLRELQPAPVEFRLWDGIDVAAELTRRTGLAVIVENDGTAAAVAELFYGAGRGSDDFLYISVGAAVGGGVVLDGQYLRGSRANAGDVAMMPVPPSRLPSAAVPGRAHDLLISRASINALIRHLIATGATIGGRGELAGAIAAHPAATAEWIEDCVAALAWAVLSAAAVLDVPLVVLDGDLERPLIERIVAGLAARLAEGAPESRPAPDVRIGSFGLDAAALGAATLPFHTIYGARPAVIAARPDRAAEERGHASAP